MAISKISGSGLGTINSPVEFTSADNLTQLTLTSTDADATTGPVLDLVRDSGSPADGDSIGQIKFTADNDAGEATIYSNINNTLRDASNGAEDGQFQVNVITNGASVDHLRMGRGSANGQSEVVFNEGSADIDFRVESNGNAFMFFIDASTDNVCIGTGTVRNAGLLSLDFDSGADGGVGLNDTASNNAAVFIGFLSGGTFRGSITNNNNGAVAYNTTSDYRLKENVSYSFDATTRLKQLKPARFNWIADSDNTAIDGFLAHEVSSIVPEAITGDKDETKTTENVVLDVNENIIGSDVTEADWLKGKQDKTYASNSTWQSTITQKHYQQIDQSKLVPLLVKSLQEALVEIATLKTKVTALEDLSKLLVE